MDRIRFVDHRGHKVLLVDYSHIASAAEMLKILDIRSAVVQAQRPASVLMLVDITGIKVHREVVARAKKAAVLDRPFIKRAALVGMDSKSKAAVDAVAAFAARRYPNFRTREEALDWLIGATVERGKSPNSATTAASGIIVGRS